MSSPERSGGVAIALVVFCMAVSGQQKPSISGIVHQVEGSPVSHAEVSVEGAGATVTSDSGQFAMAMGANLRVGLAAVFHVKNWVIIKPCELRNGRTYLRDPAAEPIEFFVLRRGDPKLRAVNASWSIIGCVIVEEASQFAKKPKADGGPRGSLHNMPFQQLRPTYLGSMPKLKGGWSYSLLVEASYKPPLLESWSPPDSRSQDPEGLGERIFSQRKRRSWASRSKNLNQRSPHGPSQFRICTRKGWRPSTMVGTKKPAHTFLSPSRRQRALSSIDMFHWPALSLSKDDMPKRSSPFGRCWRFTMTIRSF